MRLYASVGFELLDAPNTDWVAARLLTHDAAQGASSGGGDAAQPEELPPSSCKMQWCLPTVAVPEAVAVAGAVGVTAEAQPADLQR